MQGGIMNNRSATALNGILVAVVFVIAFWAIHASPAGGQVAIHWGPDNRPDAFIGGSAIQLINPIVALVVWFLLCMAPQAVQERFTGLFIGQFAIQLLLASHARGYLAF
jgi:uncharacterized membrane protein